MEQTPDVKQRRAREKWDGGYVHTQKDGRKLYILEKTIGGQHIHLSTRCHREREALEHLKRYEANPVNYLRDMKQLAAGRVEEKVGGLRVTSALVYEYRGWMLTRAEPKATTTRHANEMAHRLLDWLKDLGGADLSRLTASDLKKVVAERVTCRQHRIEAIKGFCSWLREEKSLLNRGNDPSLDLMVPQASPEKRRKKKAVLRENVVKVLEHLAPAYQDCLLLGMNVGWHVSELGRFAREPSSEIAPGVGKVLAVLQVLHKSGDTTCTPVTDPLVLAAAKRMRDRGSLPRRMNKALHTACDAAGVPRFGYGVMRHSFATWAAKAGYDPKVIAAFLNHRSDVTTKRFYIDLAVPSAVIDLSTADITAALSREKDA